MALQHPFSPQGWSTIEFDPERRQQALAAWYWRSHRDKASLLVPVFSAPNWVERGWERACNVDGLSYPASGGEMTRLTS